MQLVFHTFRIWGTLAVLLAGAAGAQIARHWRHDSRHAALLRALPMLLAALFLADCNAIRVASIRLDHSAQIARAQEEIERRQAYDDARAARRAAAEQAAATTNAVDTLAVTNAVDRPPSATTVTQHVAGARGDSEPEYRRRGVQQRAGDRVSTETVALVVDDAIQHEPGVALPGPLRYRVQRLERIMRRLLQLLAGLLGGVILWDYFRDYTDIRGPYYPLPLGGRWIDNWIPPRARVDLPDLEDRDLRHLLLQAVRKAEPFVVFSPIHLFEATIELPRLVIGTRFRLWMLPCRVYGVDDFPDDPEFLFDTLWFNRCAVTVRTHSQTEAARILEVLMDWLDRLRETRGVARRTVNLVWHLPQPPAPTLARLERLCRETNWRLWLVAPVPPPSATDSAPEMPT